MYKHMYKRKDTMLSLGDEWTVTRSERSEYVFYYLKHTHNGEDQEARLVEHIGMTCLGCKKRAPDEVIGFFRLCNWS